MPFWQRNHRLDYSENDQIIMLARDLFRLGRRNTGEVLPG